MKQLYKDWLVILDCNNTFKWLNYYKPMLEAVSLDVGTDDERVIFPAHVFNKNINGKEQRNYSNRSLLRADLIRSMSHHAGFMGLDDEKVIGEYKLFGVFGSDQRRMTPFYAGVCEKAIFKEIVENYLDVIYEEINDPKKGLKKVDHYAVNLLARDFYPCYGECFRRERDNN